MLKNIIKEKNIVYVGKEINLEKMMKEFIIFGYNTYVINLIDYIEFKDAMCGVGLWEYFVFKGICDYSIRGYEKFNSIFFISGINDIKDLRKKHTIIEEVIGLSFDLKRNRKAKIFVYFKEDYLKERYLVYSVLNKFVNAGFFLKKN